MGPDFACSLDEEKGYTKMFTQLRRHAPLRSLRRSVAVSLAGVFLCALVSPVLAAVTLPAGTKVPMEFAQTVDSRTARKGDIVKLTVSDDVLVNGEKVIAKGAPATATVMDVNKPTLFAKKAEIKLDQLRVRTVDGRLLQLGHYTSGKRVEATAPAASTGGLILLGPIGLAAGAFIHGGHMLIKPGTHIDGQVLNDTAINVAAR
jgi:hypothetical protein